MSFEYDEYDLYGLEADLLADGDGVGAQTARGCAYTIENLKEALSYIASGQALDPALFAKTQMERYEHE
jgi:hypothetical protein